ncbi:MAG: ATP-binding protein, partial [Spirochaetota bacterium]
IQYGINQTPYCDIGSLLELKILKILIENFKNREKIYKLKTFALKNKNFILSEDLENRQQTLSDLFMQFKATSENLMIKNIQVEESIKEKDRLIAIISHDLKTPLSGILSMTQQLLEDEKDESKRRKLSIMLESGNTLFLLINNLLENAKDVSTSKRLDEKIFDFNKLVYSVVSNIKEKIKEKGIELKLDYDDSIPKILIGDLLKLNQILYNLLGNSAKFTNKGYIELKLKLLEKDISSCMLMIQVSDTGIGISEDKLEHIFDPFVQEDETIKEKYGGTGLGLSIVKDYVELMGGKIDVKSEKNKGTSFTIILTFSLPKEKENAKDITKIQKYLVFNDAKILILEDNLINQEVIKGYLSDYKSLNLVFKQNGKEGLEEIEKDKYDLILSDIMMPEMDGKEFCINFRKIDKVTPLIALTAFNSKEDIDELKRIGFNSFISKPYTREELVSGISNYISVKEIIPEEKKLYELAEKAKNSEKIDRFKKLFLEDLKNRYDELKAGIENKDKEKIRFFSHNLKGIAPTLGFPQFAELAEKASLLYKEDRWDELVKIKEEFLEMVDKIYNDL